MFGRILRKMAENGSKCKKDLGLADAMEKEAKVFKQAEELRDTEASFDERMTQLETKLETKVFKRREENHERVEERDPERVEEDLQ